MIHNLWILPGAVVARRYPGGVWEPIGLSAVAALVARVEDG